MAAKWNCAELTQPTDSEKIGSTHFRDVRRLANQRIRGRFLVWEEPPPIRNESAPVCPVLEKGESSGRNWKNVCGDKTSIFLRRKWTILCFSSYLCFTVYASSLCTFYRTCYANKSSPAFDSSWWLALHTFRIAYLGCVKEDNAKGAVD